MQITFAAITDPALNFLDSINKSEKKLTPNSYIKEHSTDIVTLFSLRRQKSL